MRWMVILLLLPLGAAIDDPDPSELRYACGGGNRPEHCGINAVGGDFPGEGFKAGEPVWSQESWIADSDRVMGLAIDGDVRAVPVKMLNSHEIVNDEIGGIPVAITFCPLCGSGITFDRRIEIDGIPGATSFVASGYLWNSDMVMWDSATGSLWNQITGETIGYLNGGTPEAERYDIALDFVSSTLSTWGGWKDKHPNSLLLQPIPGKGYSENPYGDLTSDCQHGLKQDGRGYEHDCDVAGLHPKVQVVAAPDPPVAFPWIQVADNGGAFLKVGDTNYAAIADLSGDAKIFAIDLELTQSEDGWLDQDGNPWAFTEAGLAAHGERVDQGITFWFAWHDHHPETALWKTNGTQGDVQFSDGKLPGFVPWVVLGTLFVAAFLWKKRRGQA